MNNRVKRVLAAFTDFYIICFLSSGFVGIITLGKWDVTWFSVTAFGILYFIFLLVKDFLFKNASIGKRIFKIAIVKTDQTNLTIMDSFKRTLPIILLPPIEALLLIANDKRMGDMWAKTVVVSK